MYLFYTVLFFFVCFAILAIIFNTEPKWGKRFARMAITFLTMVSILLGWIIVQSGIQRTKLHRLELEREILVMKLEVGLDTAEEIEAFNDKIRRNHENFENKWQIGTIFYYDLEEIE